MNDSNQDGFANAVPEPTAQLFKQLLIDRQINAYRLSKETGIDRSYLSKLANGAIAKPGAEKLDKIARALSIEPQQLWKIFIQPAAELESTSIEPSRQVTTSTHRDWGNAPNKLICYGRNVETDALKRWIITESCKVVTLFGLEGIGKTTLAIRVSQQFEREFDYIFWRSLNNALLIEEILADMLKLFGSEQTTESSISKQISQLFIYLRTFRCLIVLDGVESTLVTNNSSKQYQQGNHFFAEFLSQMAQSQHQSCLLLVSNEKLKDMAVLESASASVRSLKLEGLNSAARNILQDKQLLQEEKWDELIRAYQGYPLALKIVATTIQEVFDGSVSEFLAQNTLFLGDLEFVLHQEYQRLSSLEKKLICTIALVTEIKSVSISQLNRELGDKIRRSEIIMSLDTFKRRSLVEVERVDDESLYGLHPVIKKYLLSQCKF